jgi:hypothetical protein
MNVHLLCGKVETGSVKRIAGFDAIKFTLITKGRKFPIKWKVCLWDTTLEPADLDSQLVFVKGAVVIRGYVKGDGTKAYSTETHVSGKQSDSIEIIGDGGKAEIAPPDDEPPASLETDDDIPF